MTKTKYEIPPIICDDFYSLDFNELQHKLPEQIRNATHSFINDFRIYSVRYPKLEYSLREKISKKWNLTTDQIIMTHGSDDALKLLVEYSLDQNDLFLTVEPSYTHIHVWAKLKKVNHKSLHLIKYKSLEDFNIPTETKLLYICSPNNPTGEVVPLDIIKDLCRKYSSTNIIIDEAYGDFNRSDESAINIVSEFNNLYVVRTFSKLYGLAALRLGYLINNRCDDFRDLYNPKSVTEIALKVGHVALNNQEHYDEIIKDINRTKWNVQRILRAFGFKDIYCGKAPFISFKKPDSFDNTNQFVEFMKNEGFGIRNRTHLPLMENYIRISMAPVKIISKAIDSISKCVKPTTYNAVILAAGMGTRMNSDIPKVLSKVEGETLLGSKIRQFSDASNILVVTGYKYELIESTLPSHVNTVYNQHFSSRNNWYSLLYGLTEIGQNHDVIMIDGDTILENSITDQIKSYKVSTMLVDDYSELDDEAMKIQTDKDGFITKCSKTISGNGEYIGALKIVKEDIKKVIRILQSCNNNDEYYDTLIGPQLPMMAISTMGKKWSEIDTKDDLKSAIDNFKNSI